MKITAIKQQVKRANRYSVYIDGKYNFSLSEPELIKLGLHQDQEITPKELSKLKGEAELDKASDRSLRYISIRPRSLYEIETYLQRKQFSKEVIATTVQRLQQAELINDKKFAYQWLEWRLASGRSRRQIQSELFKKRIDREIIDEVLSEVTDEVEVEQLKAIVERKAKLTQYQDKQKLMAYLARKGYGYELIKKALDF